MGAGLSPQSEQAAPRSRGHEAPVLPVFSRNTAPPADSVQAPLGRPGCGLLPLRRNKKPRTTAGLMWSLKLVFVA